VASADFAGALGAFFAGRCAAVTGDASELAAALIAGPADPSAFVILPDRLSKEPLAPLLRRGDDRFFDIVRWTIFALIDAEELGVTAANVDAMAVSADPAIASLLAPLPEELPGLAPRWSRDALKSGGNYGEIYARNLGAESRARLARGLNALWRDGGLLYAPPLR
jgi:general L-amino acid transport system substrate-binding protein